MSELDIEVLSYVRNHGGAITSMHDVVPKEDAGHRVVFFNPASNLNQVSWLRLFNPEDEPVTVSITGIDAAGETGESAVRLTLAGQASRSLSAQMLEFGEGEGLSGALGDGTGKWRLEVTAERPIRVMSLLQSASGAHLTNLSTGGVTIETHPPVPRPRPPTPPRPDAVEITWQECSARVNEETGETAVTVRFTLYVRRDLQHLSFFVVFLDGGFQLQARLNPGGQQWVRTLSAGSEYSHTAHGYVESTSSTMQCSALLSYSERP